MYVNALAIGDLIFFHHARPDRLITIPGMCEAVAMITKKLFLASSSDLKEDRNEFQILIGRKNNDWVPQGVYLEVTVWEDFLDAMAKIRLQDEYNKAICQCDVFVMLSG